jgi:GNAT superfamily N-acetyltransferase
MDNKLRIERISEENFESFIKLIRALAHYEKLEPPNEQAEERLRKDGLSENPKYEAYLGIVNGIAIGYVIYFMTYSSFLALPTLYIEDIFILKSHRRNGWGGQLFKFCVEQAAKHGCGRIEWCVLTWNQPAIKFYEKNQASRLDWYFYRLTADEFTKVTGVKVAGKRVPTSTN